MRTNLESYLVAQALGGGLFVQPPEAPEAEPTGGKPKRALDLLETGRTPLPEHRAVIEKMMAQASGAPATPSNLAALMLASKGAQLAPNTRAEGQDYRELAREIMKALDAGIEAGARSRWRKKKYRAALKDASAKIAQQVVKRLVADIEAGKPVGREQIQRAVADAVSETIKSVPSVLRKENLLGFGLFATGLALSGFVNVELMHVFDQATLGTKLAVQGVLGTVMGYMLAIFNPYFNDKMSNQSRALNYKILNGMMALLGEKNTEREQAQAVESAVQAQLGEVYIAHQALDGRLQGVLGLMIGFCSFIGDSFYKARYILDDEKNPNRMEDACDLMAAFFVTARLVFYAVKPEFKELFDTYIYAVLEPTLRKHAQEHGQEMYDRIMAKIRDTKPAPSEETIKKYYEPFVRGALGLDQPCANRDLLDEVKELLREQSDAPAVTG
jgi:hypothetical protein